MSVCIIVMAPVIDLDQRLRFDDNSKFGKVKMQAGIPYGHGFSLQIPCDLFEPV